MQSESIHISARGVGAFLFTAIIGIAVTSFTLQYLHLQGAYPVPYHLLRMFDLDQENNLPTWLSSVTLGICSVLLFVIARAKQTRHDSYGRHFYGLSGLFLFLSLDETASIHEVAQGPVERLMGEPGVFAGWVLPGMIVVAALGAMYLRFFLAQTRRYQVLFALAGLMYVGGAIGFEIVSWSYHPNPASPIDGANLAYVVLNLVEEVLEMLGVAVFLISLMLYIADLRLSLCCTIGH